MRFRVSAVVVCVVATVTTVSVDAFAPINLRKYYSQSSGLSATVADEKVAVAKPTGTSFLPEETIERCNAGSPIEKAKMEKDPVNAWVDVYEYARKIREGEMTWEEVEKADLDTVR
jgi:hypothetical protein